MRFLKAGLAALLIASAAPFAVAEDDEHGSPFIQMSFVAGDWAETKNGKTVEEHWVGPVGGIMAGMTVSYSEGGKTTLELMSIETRDGKIAFVARPEGQPETVFPIKESDNGYAMFENPAHDFPQRVIYTFDGADGLDAKIEGTIDGKEQSMEWHYTRMKRAQ